jgi:ferric uptake regulator family protein/6-O-methylguanine DNA methyltransferase-like protein
MEMSAIGPQPDEQDPGAVLRARGLRVTPQRRAILGAFTGAATEHLSADEVHARASASVPELSRGTVYATLAELTELGLLAAFGTAEPVRYELHVAAHQHFAAASAFASPTSTSRRFPPTAYRRAASSSSAPRSPSRASAPTARATARASRRASGAATALGTNPLALVVPCHRVTRGREITEAYVGGAERKRALRSHER